MRNIKVDNVSFAAAVVIALFHAPAWCIARGGVMSELFLRLGDLMVGASLAFFFVFAGYFLAGRFDERGWYSAAVRKRVRTLVVPYAVWSAVFAGVVYLLLHSLSGTADYGRFAGLMPGGIDRWERIDWLSFLRSGPNPILWFLKTLFALCLISPLLKFACYRECGIPIALIGVVFLGCQAVGCRVPLDALLPLRAVFFFSLGMWLRKRGMRNGDCWLFRWAEAAFVVLSCAFGFTHSALIMYLAIMALMLVAWKRMPDRELPRHLRGFSFPIYVIHYNFIFIWLYFNVRCDWFEAGTFAWMLIDGVFAVAMSILSVWLIRKLPWTVNALLFGGR